MYHTLEPVNTCHAAPHLLAMSEPTACKEVSLFKATSFPWTPTVTFDKL
jgi:hypothetical protein